MAKPRVVILGGGVAGLVTAWELSTGTWRDQFDSITLYQRGWRLGGKGASSRGVHGRIEEHGLHVLLGYYDATFRVLRSCYEELDRTRTDPDCPISTWRDAFTPTGTIGLADVREGRWDTFVTRFATNPDLPGEPGAEDRDLTPIEVVVKGIRLLGDFLVSQTGDPAKGSVYLSGDAEPTQAGPPSRLAWRGIAVAALAVSLEAMIRASEAAGALARIVELAGPLDELVAAMRDSLGDIVRADPEAYRTWLLVDLVVANIRGMIVDGLLAGPDEYRSIDHLDYREWLQKHGASDDTLDSPIVRGMYDLAFAYADGDPQRPSFSAGLGLQLATRMLFDFKGAIFWKMEAGMGETVVAPLYQVLRNRGVGVELFHRVDRLRLSGDRRSIAAIDLGRQARVAPHLDSYDPLICVDGLPCWPDAPLTEQLDGPVGSDLESHWSQAEGEPVVLEAGQDFDIAVFALSLGMVPAVCAELIANDPRWRSMVDRVQTVATQSFQLWLREDEPTLGWEQAGGVTLSGFVEPFDTWASMSHLATREQWPAADAPRTIAYFCSVMPEPTAIATPADAFAAAETVRSNAIEFLNRHAPTLWPNAADPVSSTFRWELLCDGESSGTGHEAFASQYWRANVDRSDRYVQSVPGSGEYRIKPGQSGFDNLVLAGDWTDCGLNAGCVEAATRSGVQAAAAVIRIAHRPETM